jgi:diguanylate cyclase (GGDEF)-like protein
MDSGARFALLFIDLDNFKAVNDTRGHLCGDQVLEQFASILRSTVRDSDLVGRFGGDEFVILARIEGEADAESLAARLAAATENALGRAWGVTASIGLVFYPDDAHSKRDLLSLADQAMYTAKATGRSRWCRSRVTSQGIHWSDDSFVDRTSEVSRLLPLIQANGTSSLVLVRGEAGVGKTALIAEAVRRSGMSARQMKLSCRPEFSDIPFAPLIGAIRRASSTMGVPDLPQQWGRVLGTILPDVFRGAGALEGPLERVALMEALAALLRLWRPVVINVEDAQWIDQGTLGFLLYLLSFAGDAGIPVLCALRNDDQPSSAVQTLAGLDGTMVIDLEPLGRRELVDLARMSLGVPSISEDLAASLFEVSGGNPLFAVEYLRSLHDSRQLVLRAALELAPGAQPGAFSQKIRDIVASKLSRLAPQERLTLAAAAAAGGVFDQALLSRVVDLPEGDVITALDRATRMGILVQDHADPLLFGFRNLAFRDEIARSATPSLSGGLNLALAEKYIDQGLYRQAAVCLEKAGDPARASETWISAGNSAREKKLAGEAAACFEHADALLAALPAGPATARRLLTVRQELQVLHLQTGNLDKSRECSLSAASLAADLGENDLEIELLSRAADVVRTSGHSEQALSEQLAVEKKARGSTLLMVLLRALDAASRIGNTAEADRLRRAAHLNWRRLRADNPGLDSSYYHKLVLHYICRMDLERGERAMRRALASPHAEAMDWYLYNDLGETLLLKGKVVQAIRAFETARRAAVELPSFWGQGWTTLNLATACFHGLRFERASARLEEADGIIARTTDEPARSCALILRGRILLERDDPGGASRSFEQAFSIVEQTSRDYFRSLVHSATGQWKEAIDSAESVVRQAELPGRSLQLESGMLLTLDDCLVQLHRARMEARVPGALEAMTEMIPSLRPRQRLRARALTAAELNRRGRTDVAEAMLSEASGDRTARQDLLETYRLFRIWSEWSPAAAARVSRMSRIMRS